jgi:glycerol-3-phosphate cytidylyltransferase-like family protein
MIALKQINVRLEEEFIKEVKISAINHGISVQELVKRALESYIGTKQETQQASIIETKQPIQAIKQPIKVESEQASKIASDLPEGYVPYVYDDTEEISEEERAEIAATCEWVDETPEWQQRQLEEQAKPTVIPEPIGSNTPMTKEELERFYKEEDERKQKLAEERKKTRGTSKYR